MFFVKDKVKDEDEIEDEEELAMSFLCVWHDGVAEETKNNKEILRCREMKQVQWIYQLCKLSLESSWLKLELLCVI